MISLLDAGHVGCSRSPGPMHRWSLSLVVCGMLALAGCEGGSGTSTTPAPDGGALPRPDGGGVRCAMPEEGCPCEPDGVTVECFTGPIAAGDHVECGSGIRTCAGGAWGACETTETFSLPWTGGIGSIIDGPVACNACDLDCAISRDYPTAAELTATNSSGVVHDGTGVELPCAGTCTGPGRYWRDYDSSLYCPDPEQRPDWGDFSWTATTPGNSSIRFAIRTSNTSAGLATASPVYVLVPPFATAVDVGDMLDAAGLGNYQSYLRITATLNASSDRTQTPTLVGFELQYRCVTYAQPGRSVYTCRGSPPTCSGICGDGALVGEWCDDMNTTAGDGCSRSCDIEPGWTCAGEPSVCTGICGDGIVIGTEACDDGNAIAGDGCAACVVEPGWTCAGSPSVCTPICGDGRVLTGEPCDDANVANGDGCSSACAVEPGFVCTGAPSMCEPINDTCAGAYTLSGSGSRNDPLVNASTEATGCGDGVDVFYGITATVRSMIYVDTFGSPIDTSVSYTGTTCGAAATTCVTDSCATSQSQLAVLVDPGTHYFAVHTASAATATGRFNLRYRVAPAASGDNVVLAGAGTYTGSTSGASAVGSSCGAAAASAEDAFYWLQCPGVTRTVSMNTCSAGTDYDALLHVVGPGGTLGCNDDDPTCAAGGLNSRLSVTASGAGLFQLFVDGYSNVSTGNYDLTVTTF